MHFSSSVITILYFLCLSSAGNTQRDLQIQHPHNSVHPRGVPNAPSGVQTLITPQNLTIRYKEPGKEGVCETTPDVKSYSGYIDLDANTHTFFWFFEARNNPREAPITLWLNGGPGSDSLIGLFQGLSATILAFRRRLTRPHLELGPCNVTENLTTTVNPYSWSEVTNLLFLSQPLGTGFSYGSEDDGSFSGKFLHSWSNP